MTTYDQLVKLCARHIEAYMDDLTVHDRQALEANPGRPFLHFTRTTGTYLDLLPTAETLPAKGERVPFLFGTADREKLLSELVNGVKCYVALENHKQALLFDGKKFRKLTPEKAVQFAIDHCERVRRDLRIRETC